MASGWVCGQAQPTAFSKVRASVRDRASLCPLSKPHSIFMTGPTSRWESGTEDPSPRSHVDNGQLQPTDWEPHQQPCLEPQTSAPPAPARLSASWPRHADRHRRGQRQPTRRGRGPLATAAGLQACHSPAFCSKGPAPRDPDARVSGGAAHGWDALTRREQGHLCTASDLQQPRTAKEPPESPLHGGWHRGEQPGGVRAWLAEAALLGGAALTPAPETEVTSIRRSSAGGCAPAWY